MPAVLFVGFLVFDSFNILWASKNDMAGLNENVKDGDSVLSRRFHVSIHGAVWGESCGTETQVFISLLLKVMNSLFVCWSNTRQMICGHSYHSRSVYHKHVLQKSIEENRHGQNAHWEMKVMFLQRQDCKVLSPTLLCLKEHSAHIKVRLVILRHSPPRVLQYACFFKYNSNTNLGMLRYYRHGFSPFCALKRSGKVWSQLWKMIYTNYCISKTRLLKIMRYIFIVTNS